MVDTKLKARPMSYEDYESYDGSYSYPCLICPELQDVLLIAGLLCPLHTVAVGLWVESVAELLQGVQVCLAGVGPEI